MWQRVHSTSLFSLSVLLCRSRPWRYRDISATVMISSVHMVFSVSTYYICINLRAKMRQKSFLVRTLLLFLSQLQGWIECSKCPSMVGSGTETLSTENDWKSKFKNYLFQHITRKVKIASWFFSGSCTRSEPFDHLLSSYLQLDVLRYFMLALKV